jgi:hypothetical protein
MAENTKDKTIESTDRSLNEERPLEDSEDRVNREQFVVLS